MQSKGALYSRVSEFSNFLSILTTIDKMKCNLIFIFHVITNCQILLTLLLHPVGPSWFSDALPQRSCNQFSLWTFMDFIKRYGFMEDSKLRGCSPYFSQTCFHQLTITIGKWLSDCWKKVRWCLWFTFWVCPFLRSTRKIPTYPLHPNISMHILSTVLFTFHQVLTWRICLTIKNFFS